MENPSFEFPFEPGALVKNKFVSEPLTIVRARSCFTYDGMEIDENDFPHDEEVERSHEVTVLYKGQLEKLLQTDKEWKHFCEHNLTRL